jgi:hypothetical protein
MKEVTEESYERNLQKNLMKEVTEESYEGSNRRIL